MSIPPKPPGKTLHLANGVNIHYHSIGQGPAVLFLQGSGPGASG